jgi:hypothetical protein
LDFSAVDNLLQRPVCGNCTRVPKEEPCKFADPLSRTNLHYHFNEASDVAGSSMSPSLGGAPESLGHISPGAEFSTPRSSLSELSSGKEFL